MHTTISFCPFCDQALRDGDDLVQNPVWDFDMTLDYIEVAHRACQPSWAIYDDWTPPKSARETYNDMVRAWAEGDTTISIADLNYYAQSAYHEWLDEENYREELAQAEREYQAWEAEMTAPREAEIPEPVRACEIRTAKWSDTKMDLAELRWVCLDAAFAKRQSRRSQRHAGKAQERQLLAQFG